MSTLTLGSFIYYNIFSFAPLPPVFTVDLTQVSSSPESLCTDLKLLDSGELYMLLYKLKEATVVSRGSNDLSGRAKVTMTSSILNTHTHTFGDPFIPNCQSLIRLS